MGNKFSKSSTNDGKPNKSLKPTHSKSRVQSNYLDVGPNPNLKPNPTRGSNMFEPVPIVFNWIHGDAAEAKIAAAEAEAKRVKKAEEDENARLEALWNQAYADRLKLAKKYEEDLHEGMRKLYNRNVLYVGDGTDFIKFCITAKALHEADKNIANACQYILRLFVQKFLELVRASLTMDHTPITDNCVIDEIINTYLTRHKVITEAVADRFITKVMDNLTKEVMDKFIKEVMNKFKKA